MCIVCARGLQSADNGFAGRASLDHGSREMGPWGLHPAFAIDLNGPFAFLNATDRGGTGPNGRPSLTPTGAGAQLTRSNLAWTNEGATLGAATTVTFAFRSTAPAVISEGVTGFTRFNEMQINMTLQALASWSDVANITFVRVGAGGSGDGAYSDEASILFANHGTVSESGAAFAFLPGNRAASSNAGDVWINIGLEANQSGRVFEYGRLTMVHEIGHAIGLDHPADYNAGQGSPNYTQHATYYEDTLQYSIMSYFSETHTGGNFTRAGQETAYPAAPMMDDIMAAQRLYGANMTTQTGDTVYGFNSTAGRDWFHISNAAQGAVFCVWDAGGIDTLDFSGYAQNQIIDLRAGAFSSVGGLVGNVGIAVGATIERAIGGSGNDTLVGNAAANTFRGNGGNDVINGGDGVDSALYLGVRRQYVASSTGVSGNGEGADTVTAVENCVFTDGVLTFDVNSLAAQVMRMYDAALDRQPDQGGFEAQLDNLERGMTLATLADAFVNSAEFQARYGTLSNQQFVEQLYRFCLKREGDPGGVAGWVNNLNNGLSRRDALVFFSESAEHRTVTATTLNRGLWVADDQAIIIARMYDATFDRLADAGGLAAWTANLKAGMALIDIAAAFATAPEFQQRYGALTNAQFIDQMYRFCLNRAADPDGLAHWINALNTGTSRAQMLLNFSESAEHAALTRSLWLGGIQVQGATAVISEDDVKPVAGDAQVLPALADEAGPLINGGSGDALLLKTWDADPFVLPMIGHDASVLLAPGGPGDFRMVTDPLAVDAGDGEAFVLPAMPDDHGPLVLPDDGVVLSVETFMLGLAPRRQGYALPFDPTDPSLDSPPPWQDHATGHWLH